MAVLPAFGAGLQAQDIGFDLIWDAPSSVAGDADETLSAEANGLLVINGLDDAEDGVQGWSIGMAAQGWSITDVSLDGTVGAEAPDGLRQNGFEKTEITSGPGNEGALSAIVLAFTEPIFLLGAESPHTLIRCSLEGTAPREEGTCEPGRILFVDGLVGSGQPLENKVTYRGQTYRPTKGETSIERCAVKNCCDAPLNLIFQTENSGNSDELFVGDIRPTCNDLSPGSNTLEIDTLLGEVGSARIWAGIVSQLETNGVQGWSVSLAVSGDVEIADVSLEGTGADELIDGGFSKTEIVDPLIVHPDTAEEQGSGAVSAVVLSFTKPVTLAVQGTSSILSIDIAATEAQGEEVLSGEITSFDFMRGSGQPVRTVGTVNGGTRPFCEDRSLGIAFLPQRDPLFLRCDANNDGKTNIADPIWIVNELFRSGPLSVCQKAADCNDDGTVDLSDATYAISHEFLGGPPPSAPHPECGFDPTEDDLPCEIGVTDCN